MSSRLRLLASGLVLALTSGVVAIVLSPVAAPAGTPLTGFQEQIVLSGLNRPTNIEFAPDGRIFIAEQQGTIKVFDSLSDTSATIFADLRANVLKVGDRGLLGLALPPDFLANPWVYVAYTYDAPPGGTAPTWNDSCSAEIVTGSCVATTRVSRLPVNGNTAGPEQVLLTGWCQQYESHSVGDLQFGSDGALYITGGDGANFNSTDWGQLGSPLNPCGDPANEGGALRVQDIRTPADPTGYNGTLLRVDPETGNPMPGNPNLSSPDPDARRIVAYGLRNPFRAVVRPGTNEVWIADVGWVQWEEINRVIDPTAGLTNFGWPCYEGSPTNSSYNNAEIPLCESLYTQGPPPTAPYHAWQHVDRVVPGETCVPGGSSATGLAFYPTTGGLYPATYQGALFFADYARDCIWAMTVTPDSNGLPSPSSIETFVAAAADPVDLEIGPGGELYYVNLGGTIRRLRYYAGNQPPRAYIDADPTAGELPLAVHFDGTDSTDADPADQGRLTYAWDFTNDGTIDSTSPTPTFSYTTQGVHTAKLTVTDTLAATASTTIQVLAGLGGPTAVIDTPASGTTWATGDTINFSGHATDPQDGTLDQSRLSWRLRLQHCAVSLVNCHSHVVQEWVGASGSFQTPEHEYPSYLELDLIATDSDDVKHTVTRRLDPRTSPVTFRTSTPGLMLTVGSFTGQTPFTLNMIHGSPSTVSAPSPQFLNSNKYAFTGWSDGGAVNHVINGPTTPAEFTVNYSATSVVNLALNKTATTNTTCNANETAPKAVNGSVNGGFNDKWCGAPGIPDKWLMIDLGASHDISAFVLHHAAAGGENPAYNTRDFTIETGNDATTWTATATVTANTAAVTTHPVTVNARYARLRITTPSSNGNTAARIYEFKIIGH